jgi:hypothetical protein
LISCSILIKVGLTCENADTQQEGRVQVARGTPKQRSKQAAEGTVFPSMALARNVKAYRQMRGLKQEEVGAQMSRLGWDWNAGTCGFVERGDRAVDVDELVGLAVLLDVPIAGLLDPTGFDGRNQVGLDLGVGRSPGRRKNTTKGMLSPAQAREFVNGRLRVYQDSVGDFLMEGLR